MADPSLASLTERLQRVEDQLAIYQLIAAYGPAVDRADGLGAGALWTKDGTYDAGGTLAFQGRHGVVGLVDSDLHRGYDLGAVDFLVKQVPRQVL